MKKKVGSRITALLAIILTVLVLGLSGCRAGDADTSPDSDSSITAAEDSAEEDETVIIEKEFTIELDENQSTGSL